MHLLEVKNLHVEVDGKKILNGLDLVVEKGQVAAIMGPNGSGKSTLAHVLAGKADYVVTQGEVLLDGEDILALAPDERAAKGLFLAFQYPLEIPGVATMTFDGGWTVRVGPGEAGFMAAQAPHTHLNSDDHGPAVERRVVDEGQLRRMRGLSGRRDAANGGSGRCGARPTVVWWQPVKNALANRA